MGNIVSWLGYEFQSFPRNVEWNCVPAVYIFTGLDASGQWRPLYVGRTAALAARLATHPRWSEAERLGGTHVHVAVVPEEMTQQALEKELIAEYQPPLNVQHRLRTFADLS